MTAIEEVAALVQNGAVREALLQVHNGRARVAIVRLEEDETVLGVGEVIEEAAAEALHTLRRMQRS